MGVKINCLNLVQKLIVLLLFFAGMNLAQKCFYYIYAAIIVICFFRRRNLKLDVGVIILLLFSISYLIFYPEARANTLQIMKHLAYPACYVIGLNFMSDKNLKYNTEEVLTTTLIIVGMGSFVHYILNMMINIGNINRNTTDIWTNEVMSATTQAMMAVIAVGIFSAIMFTDRKWKIRLFAILGMVIALGYNLILAGRTLLVLTVILMLFALGYTNKNNKRWMKKKNAFMVLGVIGALTLIYNTDLWGIRTNIWSSNFIKRLMGMQNIEEITRAEIKLEYLKLSLKYPFGGAKIRQLLRYYAHDLFLDTYNDAGVLTWLVLVIFISYAVIKVIKKIRQDIWSINLKTLILCIYISIFVGFFVEPILSGMPWMFCIFCFYQGAINSNKKSMVEVHK